MSVNNEYRFGIVPQVTTPRSKFLMHQNIRTTFNTGKLIPFFVDTDIMPGDTFKLSGTMVVRMSTPIYPTMDNMFADVRWFFVPHRLTWNHWKAFMGENETGAWYNQTSYTVPQIVIGKSGTNANLRIAKGDNLQYMGIPIGYPSSFTSSGTTDGAKFSALPYRALCQTWNDWYRDENFCPPIYYNHGDADANAERNNAWGTYSTSTGAELSCPPVFKFKDMFNSCLPEPQAGPAVTLPIGQSAPVIGTGMSMGLTNGTDLGALYKGSSYLDANITTYGSNVGTTNSGTNLTGNKTIGLTTDASKSGIIADLSNAVAATINAQRMAFATQRILEQSARSGRRYVEIIKGFWGVTSPSATQQRSQYLFGKRLPINMAQVTQTSSTDSTSPQGNTAAYSLTVDSEYYGTFSATEHGTLLGVVCVRPEHSYDTGIAKMWQRKNKLDFYWPQLAFLGEEPITNKTIYADGSAADEQVFGYNERWVEYRTKVNINTGAFSTKYPQTLASWHYGDAYNSLPVLSDTWRRETTANVDRTLAVTSAVEDNFLMDSRWEFEATRCCPLYSVPGLLDHF